MRAITMAAAALAALAGASGYMDARPSYQPEPDAPPPPKDGLKRSERRRQAKAARKVQRRKGKR